MTNPNKVYDTTQNLNLLQPLQIVFYISGPIEQPLNWNDFGLLWITTNHVRIRSHYSHYFPYFADFGQFLTKISGLTTFLPNGPQN